MSDEPIVLDTDVRLERYQKNGPERACLFRPTFTERVDMPWSDWLALARKILEREEAK